MEREFTRKKNETNYEKITKLRTVVYPSNIAPIGAKLRQRTFRTIGNIRFFDAGFFFFRNFFRVRKSIFHYFRQVFEALDIF